MVVNIVDKLRIYIMLRFLKVAIYIFSFILLIFGIEFLHKKKYTNNSNNNQIITEKPNNDTPSTKSQMRELSIDDEKDSVISSPIHSSRTETTSETKSEDTTDLGDKPKSVKNFSFMIKKYKPKAITKQSNVEETQSKTKIVLDQYEDKLEAAFALMDTITVTDSRLTKTKKEINDIFNKLRAIEKKQEIHDLKSQEYLKRYQKIKNIILGKEKFVFKEWSDISSDYYEVLGIKRSQLEALTSQEQRKLLRKKYNKMMLKYHPDRLTNKSDNEKEGAIKIFFKVQEAWEVLGNEETRKCYDGGQTYDELAGFNATTIKNIEDIIDWFEKEFTTRLEVLHDLDRQLSEIWKSIFTEFSVADIALMAKLHSR